MNWIKLQNKNKLLASLKGIVCCETYGALQLQLLNNIWLLFQIFNQKYTIMTFFHIIIYISHYYSRRWTIVFTRHNNCFSSITKNYNTFAPCELFGKCIKNIKYMMQKYCYIHYHVKSLSHIPQPSFFVVVIIYVPVSKLQ